MALILIDWGNLGTSFCEKYLFAILLLIKPVRNTDSHFIGAIISLGDTQSQSTAVLKGDSSRNHSTSLQAISLSLRDELSMNYFYSWRHTCANVVSNFWRLVWYSIFYLDLFDHQYPFKIFLPTSFYGLSVSDSFEPYFDYSRSSRMYFHFLSISMH